MKAPNTTISRELKDKLIGAGWNKIHFYITGGSDEACIHASAQMRNADVHRVMPDDLTWEIKEAMFPNFNGAGNGIDYGYDVFIDLESNSVSYTEWEMVEQRCPTRNEPLNIE